MLHRMQLSCCALKIYNYFNLTQMKMLWAKLFCRHLFWMVIWFLTLHMEDLTWGLAALFMCPNVFCGFVFSKQTSSAFAGAVFLSLQLTLLSKGYWEGVKWDSLQHKEWHNSGHPELEQGGDSLKHSCKSIFGDGKNQASCVLWMKAAVSGTADTSRALFWGGQCADMGLTCVVETHVFEASGTLGLIMWKAALVSQVLGQERLLMHLSVHGEKHLLLGVLLLWVLLWKLTQMTPGKQILRLFSAADMKKGRRVLGSSALAFSACMKWS